MGGSVLRGMRLQRGLQRWTDTLGLGGRECSGRARVVRPVHARERRGDLGGADSRAGGSGAGLRARIAGLVEGKVPRKPIGAVARVRKRARAEQMREGYLCRGMRCDSSPRGSETQMKRQGRSV